MRRADLQRPVGHSVRRFREGGWYIFAEMLALCNLLLLQSLFYVARNLHVFHLDVQSAGSLQDDGQSVRALQAVLSVLSQLLGFIIRLFSSLVSARRKQPCLSLLPSLTLVPAEHARHFGGCSQCAEHPEIQICLLRLIMYLDPLWFFFQYFP